MNEDSTKALSKVIRIDESEIQSHLDKMVRGTVEDALNAMLDAEADEMCNAQWQAQDFWSTHAVRVMGDWFSLFCSHCCLNCIGVRPFKEPCGLTVLYSSSQ